MTFENAFNSELKAESLNNNNNSACEPIEGLKKSSGIEPGATIFKQQQSQLIAPEKYIFIKNKIIVLKREHQVKNFNLIFFFRLFF